MTGNQAVNQGKYSEVRRRRNRLIQTGGKIFNVRSRSVSPEQPVVANVVACLSIPTWQGLII
jgi:hypothetical protein